MIGLITSSKWMRFAVVVLSGLAVVGSSAAETASLAQETKLAANGGAPAGERYRVIVSTDIGGTDPDDFQSMVHLLVYADCFDIEGLISSPYGPGRKQHIAGHGALGDFFVNKKDDIKMGDTPSVGWLLKGTPEDPSQPGWGGQLVRAWDRPHSVFNRLTTTDDRMEVFGILELVLPLGDTAPDRPEAQLVVENQSLVGHAPGNGTVRFRFCPKDATTYRFKIRSNAPALDGKTGGITAVVPTAEVSQRPDSRFPNWWTDDPAPQFAEGAHRGAKTVSRWRQEYLRNFAEKMACCNTSKSR